MIAALMLRLAPYRAMFIAAALAIALASAAAGGAVVNGWRLDGDHQRALTAKQEAYDALAETVREQNLAIAAMSAAKTAAEDRRKAAEQFAAAAIARTGARADAVKASKATDCAGVLHEQWEGWK